ncbi:MAG: elongation factor EF-2 [Candidatus Diapherotrites archaeon]|nr:elongation factor EF-2 [Candidatus Diapherotrites archaeon]
MGRKEEMARRAQSLMGNQKDVRNIGIVAHIDHGKCVSPGTRLLFSDGQAVTAKDVFERLSEKGKIVRENANEIVYELNEETPHVFSLNKATRAIETKRISHAWKLKGGRTLKVKLRNGMQVETTPEHRYLVFDGGEFAEKMAMNLEINDRIVALANHSAYFTEIKHETGNQLALQLVNPANLMVEPIEIEKIVESYCETVYDFTIKENHNFIAEGMVIHNTTLSDFLIASAGLISKELAGKQQFMDFEDQEQERGITINAANISLVPSVNGKEFLLNLIDTPGHVDFGGEVTRAMRAVDGVILVVDAVEGVMPQTETVIRQALRENVKPTLFINKCDRLIKELKIDEKEMQNRFVKTITQVNNLIRKNAPEQFKEKWQVNPAHGSVSFGSAFNHWAVSVPSMQRTGINFKHVYDYMLNDKQKDLAGKSPLDQTIFEMVLTHLPSPVEAQAYRAKVIWSGDPESPLGKAMRTCDIQGPLAMMVTDVSVDPHAGDIATGRLYAGKVHKGVKIKLIGLQKEAIIQRVGVYMGPEFVEIEEVPAGSIAAIVGLKEAFAGQTISTEEMLEFESFKTNVEPVITVSIEAKQTKDLPKLIEVLRQLTKEDPNLRATVNQQTGEHLLSGMGELHLEINQYRIEKHHHVPITVSPPIVVYHESITKESPSLEGKSPNKHNKFLMRVEPIPRDIFEKLALEKIQAKVRPKDKELVQKFIDIGFDNDTAKKVWCVHNNNVLVDATRGIQALHEVKELVIQGFQDAMNEGPLAKEKCAGMTVFLEDAKLHEDAIHRGPAQVLPAITRTIYACMLSSDPILQEPKQTLTITVPQDFLGAVSKELGARRTQIQEIRMEGDTNIVIGIAPVKELIGFAASMRGATQGRAMWTAEYYGYEPLPRELQKIVITEVRKRKGLDPEVKPAGFFLE